jgi:hypothetical protein
MKNFKWLLPFLLMAISSVAQEGPPSAIQGSILDTVALPGQFWSVNGTLEPVEKGNVFTESRFEQGATVFATAGHSVTLVPYVALGFVADTKGYTYNNEIDPSVGIRLNKYFRSGVVSIGTAYADEDRYFGATASGRTDYAQYWFGWQPVADVKSRFPGSSWGTIGNISPVEHGNYIFMDYVTQAYILHRFGARKTEALMPYSEITLSKDTKGFDWENKAVEGGGIKYSIPKGEFYTEFGAGYLHENRFDSGLSASGLKVFMNFSYAWNLFGRKAR